MNWRFQDPLLVAYVDERQGSIRAFNRTGNEVVATVAEIANHDPLLVIQHAEPKFLRINPQSSGPGPVIQDVDDGESGVRYIFHFASGDSLVHDVADSLSLDEFVNTAVRPVPGPQLSTHSACTQLYAASGTGLVIWNYLQLSVRDQLGDNEWQYRTHFWCSGSYVARIDTEFNTPSPDYDVHAWKKTLGFRRPVADWGEDIRIDIVERDSPFGVDEFGPTVRIYETTTPFETMGHGELVCGYQATWGTVYGCYPDQFWYELNLSFAFLGTT